MNVFKSYFDFLLPELRVFHYSFWIKVMVIYKIVLPLLFFTFYLTFQEHFRDQDLLELQSNIILLIIGIENGIGIFSWFISETFSIYTILFTGLQFYYKIYGQLSGPIHQEKQNTSEWFLIFQYFNTMMYKGLCWINLATMIPAIFMLILITICTCQIQLFLSLIKRKLPNSKYETFQEYIGNEEIECSICMEDIKQMEKYTELPCHHIFHYKCFGKWKYYETKIKSTCPICRQTINYDNINDQIKRNQTNTIIQINETLFIQ